MARVQQIGTKSTKATAEALSEALRQSGKDAVSFALLTLLITPFLLVLAAGGVVVAVAYMAPALLRGSSPTATGMAALMLFLAFAFVSSWPKCRAQGATGHLSAAAGVYVALLVLTVMALKSDHVSGAFIALYVALVIVILGLLGRGYTPRDSYYLGLYGGRFDDPFTYRDDADRAHVGIGCAMAIPGLLLDSIGQAVSTSWLWRGVSPDVVRASTKVLMGVAAGRGSETLRSVGAQRGVVLRVLKRLDLVQIRKNDLRLTENGIKFLKEV